MDAKEYFCNKVLCLGYKQLLLISFCFLLTIQLNAQTKDRPIWLSVSIGHQEYRGDLENEFLDYEFGTNWVLGYQGSMYLSPSIDLGLNLSIGELDIQNGFIQGNPGLSETAFSKTYVNTFLFGRFKFANGSILPENSFLQPYLNAGIGFTAFGGGDENIKNGLTFTLPGTLGLDIPINETIKLYVQSTYNRTFADGFDGSDRLDDRSHDDYMVYAAGVKIALSASKRESGQGISEPHFNATVPPPTADKAEETKETEKESAELPATDGNGFSDEIKGPEKTPDSDGDGFNNDMDSCPQIAGVDYLKGCPDADGDEMGDAEDECPKIAGEAALQGCPDDDSDGLMNSADKCPNEAGLKELNGCPVKKDRDNDDIIDEEDACPDEPGIRKLKGCPPRDNDEDGVTDDRDECPNEAGVAEINGCPKEEEDKTETVVEKERPTEKDLIVGVSADMKKKVDAIYNNLRYKPGKAIIMDSSKGDLDRLAQIMEDDPKLQLLIEGYTDNEGKASYNLLLSRDRADAVKQYLMGKGISEDRLRAEGYGEILPIAPNDTEAGRAKNRRIELRLTYF